MTYDKDPAEEAAWECAFRRNGGAPGSENDRQCTKHEFLLGVQWCRENELRNAYSAGFRDASDLEVSEKVHSFKEILDFCNKGWLDYEKSKGER